MSDQFGPYQLRELIGRGGMGEVFRAFDTRRNRIVALKRLTADLADDADFTSRFRRESELVAQMREPHVIPIHDFGEIEGRLFIDMRLVEGVDLGTVLEREGPMAPARAVDIIGQVARALDAAHRDGLVHRDVKPSNVLIDHEGGDDEFVYLIDFGIARGAGNTNLTASGAVMGTAAYMSPERFEGKGDHRVDIYALGCVLYETLTGTVPFPGELLTQMYAHLHNAPPRPSARRPGVPPGLDRVIERAMAKDPEQRFGRAGELVAAARQALAAPSRQPAPVQGFYQPGPAPAPQSGPGRPPGYTTPPGGHQWPGPHQQPPPYPGPPPGPPGGPPPQKPSSNRLPLIIAGAVVAVVIVVLGVILAVRDENDTELSAEAGGDPVTTSAPRTPSGGAPAEVTVRPGASWDDPQGRFSLRPPDGWSIDTSDDSLVVVFLAGETLSTPQGPFRANINIVAGPAVGGVEDLLDTSRTDLATLTDYQATLDEPITLSDGTPAHLFGGTFTDDATGFELQNLQVLAVANGQLVVVTGTSPTGAWSTYEAVLDRTLRTLTLS